MKAIASIFFALILGLSIASGVDVRGGCRFRENSSTHSSEVSQVLSSSTSSVPKSVSEFVRPEAPPKYFAIDVDGTFTTDNKDGMKKNIEAFAEVRKKGYTPFLCTGRAKNSALSLINEDFTKKTGYEGYPGVYKNGSLVYDESGKVLNLCTFPETFLKTLCGFLTTNSLISNVMFYDEEDAFSFVEEHNNKVVSKMVPGKYTIPQHITFDELLKKPIIMIKYFGFEFNVPGLKSGTDYIEKVDVNGTFDLSPPNVTKASGIKTLMEYYGVLPEDCAFIGDGDNDIEAMGRSKISFAVANASAKAKEHAKWVMDKTCDEGAVAEALTLVYGL